MSDRDIINRDPLLEMFIFETAQLIEQLEELLIDIEKESRITAGSVNEIFRIMHTIKGSSAMMAYDGMAALAHTLEDLFETIRSHPEIPVDCVRLTDHVLHAVDCIKNDMAAIESGQEPRTDAADLIAQIRQFHREIKGEPAAPDAKNSGMTAPERQSEPVTTGQSHDPVSRTEENHPSSDTAGVAVRSDLAAAGDVTRYMARIFFEEGCQMENMRAYTVVHQLQGQVIDLWHEPEDLLDEDKSAALIREQGLALYFTSVAPRDELFGILDQTILMDRLEFAPVDRFPDGIGQSGTDRAPAEPVAEQAATDPELAEPDPVSDPAQTADKEARADGETRNSSVRVQSVISVHINKLDHLMDLVGELVISEAMVTRNPELENLPLDNFHKAARQLRKLTNELQDIVMSIRMIPVAATFHKMQRVVRDMTRKLGKTVELQLLGENTEVDKSIVDQLADPLMHLIRNALDHGIESPAERLAAGKPEQGHVTLEAKNAGSDVWIIIRDDGRGLDRQKILDKAAAKGLLNRPEQEYSDKEIFSFILMPGFSTKDEVSEFSGRGVGMDVVRSNISKIGGSIGLDSTAGQGTTITIRIPLTLAIIDGMLIQVGKSTYIIPITAIRESFKAQPEQIITDTEGNEMFMIRGDCVNVCRLHQRFNVATDVRALEDGIIIIVEDDGQTLCLFADRLVGEQQVVVKPLPDYIQKARGLAGCTILGDGNISLILDIAGFID